MFWPDPDPDLSWHLHAYTHTGSPDTFTAEDAAKTWSVELADIPYDTGLSPPPPAPLPESYEKLPSTQVSACGEPPQPASLPPYERLSFLPSIVTLDSSILGQFPFVHPKVSGSRACSTVAELQPTRKAASPPLRRRQVIYDLRKAFQFPYTVEHPTHSRSWTSLDHLAPTQEDLSSHEYATAICRARLSDGIDKRQVAILRRESAEERLAACRSFEHEITVALLATMDSYKSVVTPNITLQHSDSGQSSRSQGPAGAACGGGGLSLGDVRVRRAEMKIRKRSKGCAIFRKLKAMVRAPYCK